MKKNIIIVLFLITCLLGAFALKSHAQASYLDTPYATKDVKFVCGNVTSKLQDINKPVIIADETTISYSKNTAKIECSNGEIAEKILKRYEQLVKRYSVTWKSDRHGRYKEYVIVFNKEDSNLVTAWIKNNL